MKWTTSKLADLCTMKTGKTPPTSVAEYFGGDVHWFCPADVGVEQRLTSSTRTITSKAIKENKGVVFGAGSVLVTCIGEIGRCGILTGAASSNQQITALTFRKEIDPRFAYYWVKANKNRLQAAANNAVVPILNNRVLGSLEFSYPSLSEQKQIADTLDKASALRKKDEQLSQKYDDLAQAVFYEMFGDPVHNTCGWGLRKFCEIGRLDRGVSKNRPRNAPELLGGPYPLIQTGDIANSGGYITSYNQTYSELGLQQSRLWNKGTLCITIAANIAKTGILTFDACFPDSVVGFAPNDLVTINYVRFWLGYLQKTLEETAPESAQKNINLEILRSLLIPVPPIESQRLFEQRLFGIQQQKEVVRQSAVKSDQLFNSMISIHFS